MKRMNFYRIEWMQRWLFGLPPYLWYAISGSVLVISCSILMQYGYYPLARSLMQKKIYAHSLAHDNAATYEHTIRSLRKKLRQAERCQKLYDSWVMPDALFTVMQNHEVSLLSYAHQPGALCDGSMIHTMRMQGSYESLYGMLSQIEEIVAPLVMSSWSLRAHESFYELDMALEEFSQSKKALQLEKAEGLGG